MYQYMSVKISRKPGRIQEEARMERKPYGSETFFFLTFFWTCEIHSRQWQRAGSYVPLPPSQGRVPTQTECHPLTKLKQGVHACSFQWLQPLTILDGTKGYFSTLANRNCYDFALHDCSCILSFASVCLLPTCSHMP